jgi:NTE family protein
VSKRVALVMASGGLKQLVALPAIDYLDRQGYQIAALVGTSGGALIAALRAAGRSAQEIQSEAQRLWQVTLFRPIRMRSILGLLGWPAGRWRPGDGLIDSSRIRTALHQVFGDIHLEELRIPVICMATDFTTGEAVAITKGRVVDAVYASLAQPPLLPAAAVAGRLFVDGGYTDSVAVERAFTFEPDAIISFTVEERPPPSRQLGDRYASLLTQVNSELERWILVNALPKFAGEMINLNTRFERRIPFWDVGAIPDIVKAGAANIGELRCRLEALELA